MYSEKQNSLLILFQTEKYKDEALLLTPGLEGGSFGGSGFAGSGCAPSSSSGQKTTTFIINEIGYSKNVSNNYFILMP